MTRSTREKQTTRRGAGDSPDRDLRILPEPEQSTETLGDSEFVQVNEDDDDSSNEDNQNRETSTPPETEGGARGPPAEKQHPEIGGGLGKATSYETDPQKWIMKLAQRLWDAEDRGDPEEAITTLRKRLERAEQLVGDRTPNGEMTERPQNKTKEASETL